jgi:hypothetical protein
MLRGVNGLYGNRVKCDWLKKRIGERAPVRGYYSTDVLGWKGPEADQVSTGAGEDEGVLGMEGNVQVPQLATKGLDKFFGNQGERTVMDKIMEKAGDY